MTNENQYDDAEFALFLQGSGELASKLKGVDIPGPSAELDTAILARIEQALAQEAAAKSVAANDPVVPGVRPSDYPTSKWITRWRVPLGLAAGLFLGVLLHRSFQSESPVESVARLSRASQPAPIVAQQMAPAPPMAAELPAIASADLAAPAPVPRKVSPPENRRDMSAGAEATPAELSAAMPAPADIVVASPIVARSAAPKVEAAPIVASDSVQRVEITGSTVRRADVETASPVQVIIAQDIMNSPVTQSGASSGYSSGERGVAQRFSGPAPVAAAPSVAAKPAPQPMAIQKSPQEWLVLIEENLKVGWNDEAVENWDKFRKAYPDYPVRDGLKEKISALQNHRGQK
jgi:hypothetical protein